MPKVSDFIAQFLAENGVKAIFELSGGMISHLLDSFAAHPDLTIISVHHEQAGAFAAEAIGRLTGLPAVALGTSGPGALNLLSGIASCYYDSVPAVFISGDVQTYMEVRNRPLRQFGLQECQFGQVAAPISKAVLNPRRATEVPAALQAAFSIAIDGRPGPVVIELPFDVQGAVANLESIPIKASTPQRPDGSALAAAIYALTSANRPLILAGGGVRHPRACEALRQFVAKSQIPCATSIAALDVLDSSDPLRIGLVGMYGPRAGNLAISESDAVLIVGSRVDAGLIGADPATFERGKTIIRVDCDEVELVARLKRATTIKADCSGFLHAATEAWPSDFGERFSSWCSRVHELARNYPDTAEHDDSAGINPNAFMRDLSETSKYAGAYVVDAGQHTWWAAQSLRIRNNQRFLAPTGLWAMGSALPAAIGVAVVTKTPVVAIAGDAALQLNIQELDTIVRYRLPIKIVVINNRCHGMVRQFQDEFFEGRHPSTAWGYSPPNFTAIAGAYNIRAATVSRPEDVAAGLAQMWANPLDPFLLDLSIPLETNVYPYVSFGHAITAMIPPTKAVENFQ
jgi:acetolactate synthase-1/2/3 large subunit